MQRVTTESRSCYDYLMSLKSLIRRRFRPLRLAGIVGFTVMEIVALSPSSLEEEESNVNTPIDPQALTPDTSNTLASGIPKGIPEYQVERFDYVSTQDGVKQWNLIAERAALYNKVKLVHARVVKANLFDPDGKITIVTGKEAKYFMHEKDLEVFGDVVATFPDGFLLFSDYLRYRPSERIIDIPTSYRVHGGSKAENGQDMRFESNGFHYWMGKSQILLPEKVHLTMTRPGKPDDSTAIDSDQCVIHRDRQIADFSMEPWRQASERFVHITQPTLFTRSRTAKLNYGADSSSLLQYLVAYDDVLIKQVPLPEDLELEPETGPASKPSPSPKAKEGLLKYATAGRADFDNQRNLIVLTRFPQAYQDNDTVTGDIIKMHRDSDIIEVENSNSFSQGDDSSGP
jgi:LPS export ABC transporter protein LptC